MQRLGVLLIAAFVVVAPAAQATEDLLIAARNGETALVRSLLDAGHDPNGILRKTYSPLMFAAGNGHVEMTRLLLARGATVDHRDHNGDRALLWAAERGHDETVRMLLVAGAAVQSDDDPHRTTPLIKAAGYARVEVVRMLLAAGADARHRGQSDDTALHQAAISGNAAIITMLLAAGADPGAVGSLNTTPLHRAANFARLDAVRLLAASGADLNTRDYLGRTPLWLAASLGHEAMLDALLAAGADHDARDDKDVSPFLAAIAKSGTAARLLVELTRDIDRGFAAAVWNGRADLARRLAERGADVNALDQHGRPAVAGAAQHPGTAMLEWLITGGVNLDRHGAAALHQAASSGRLDLVRLLLDLNVPVDARDGAGATALLHGARAGQLDVVQFLLARGAERYPGDREGRGIEAYMAMAVGPIAAMIAQRERSRAYRPTGHLRQQLAALTAQHAAVRELLAQ
jgi:ankyrin repeat protein